MAGFISLMPALAQPNSAEGPGYGARFMLAGEQLALPPFALRPWPKTFQEAAQAAVKYPAVAPATAQEPVKVAIAEKAVAVYRNWKPFAAGMTVVLGIWGICAFSKLQSLGFTPGFTSGFNQFLDSHASTEVSQNFRGARITSFTTVGSTSRLRDYHVEFMAETSQGGIGLALRTLNPRNYYAVRLHIVRTHGKPEVYVERYAVLDGIKQKPMNFPIPAKIFADQPFVASVDVNGGDYQLAVGGDVVDSWKYDRLEKGGVGFFADSASKTKLSWVKVLGNPGFLGRLCATLKGSAQGS